MKKERRHFTAEDKVAALRKHLVDQVPVPDLCDEYQIQPAQFYLWQKLFIENGAAVFQKAGRKAKDVQTERIAARQQELAKKNEVVAELLEEHVQLKKEFGELWTEAGFPTTLATRSWTTSLAGRTARSCRPGSSSPGWGSTPASSMTGNCGTARSTSTTAWFRATGGWRIGRRKPSSTTTAAIRWKAIGG